MTAPSQEFFGALQNAFNHFNQELFNGKLPDCLITTQRDTFVLGHFSPLRWVNKKGKKAHEIGINPSYFAQSNLLEICQTLVHEQCHLWQQEYGKPSRNGYHNKQWAQKMISVGLIPSNTGEPGGKQTGQQMDDYPEPGGRFEQSCRALIQKTDLLPWIDRRPSFKPTTTLIYPEPEEQTDPIIEALHTPLTTLMPHITLEPPARAAKRKSSYSCPTCGIKVWGKPNLHIVCGDCNQPLL